MSLAVSKTTPSPAKALHTSLSAEASSSKALGLVDRGFSDQYRGKPSSAVGSNLVAHLEELSPPPLERVLEEGEDDAAGDAGEAHPETLALLLHLEEVKKDVHGGGDAQVPAENLETPYERPAVGVKLGRGSVNLGE